MNDGPILEVAQLHFVYPDGKTALEEVSFTVPAGQCIALVGPNGAGKTTLFLCLAGVLRVAPGRVSLAGLDPAVVADRKRLPAQVGIIFQNSDDQLFSTTVADDVAFGPLNLGLPDDEVKRRVADALARVGLSGLGERVPHHLSGGEKRRVAIASVLAMTPRLLLLDEPSMFLDPRGRRGLIDLLGRIGGTQLIASHDLELVLSTCRRVLVLDSGRIVADGEARTVLADRATMETHGLEVPYSLR